MYIESIVRCPTNDNFTLHERHYGHVEGMCNNEPSLLANFSHETSAWPMSSTTELNPTSPSTRASSPQPSCEYSRRAQ